ncbi:MAG TPA: hypothetical protein ENK55_04595 [Actinobacteria bacterium]|nr:hypothetical protein [Actinomycetota bacterium]
MRPTVVSILVGIALVGATPPVGSVEPPACPERYPEARWERLPTSGVEVWASGVPEGLAGRFDREIEEAGATIAAEIGPFAAVVCIVDPTGGFDASRYETPGRRFHAVRDLPAGVVTISDERVGQVGPAVAFALSQIALWQRSEGEGWPEPLAGAIGAWYRSRAEDRVELDHAVAMMANFFETEASIDWARSRQDPVVAWDPEAVARPRLETCSIRGCTPATIGAWVPGDVVDFAVATEGAEVLTDPDPARWGRIEGAWRRALRDELRGSTTDSTGWRGGVLVVAGSLVAALAVAVAGYAAKRRRRRRRPTPPPIPGFFEEVQPTDAAAVDTRGSAAP